MRTDGEEKSLRSLDSLVLDLLAGLDLVAGRILLNSATVVVIVKRELVLLVFLPSVSSGPKALPQL